MNRFIIVKNLPYLYVNGETFKVRWSERGFIVGAKINLKLKEKPITYSEISIKAKCSDLDSIKESVE